MKSAHPVKRVSGDWETSGDAQHLLVATEYLGRAGSPRAEAESAVALAKMDEAAGLTQSGRVRWKGP